MYIILLSSSVWLLLIALLDTVDAAIKFRDAHKSTDCRNWALTGECARNIKFMWTSCAASCNFADPNSRPADFETNILKNIPV